MAMNAEDLPNELNPTPANEVVITTKAKGVAVSSDKFTLNKVEVPKAKEQQLCRMKVLGCLFQSQQSEVRPLLIKVKGQRYLVTGQ